MQLLSATLLKYCIILYCVYSLFAVSLNIGFGGLRFLK